MKGKIVVKQGQVTPNGRERILQVRAGAKGTGRQIGPDIIYWPWSGISVEKAFDIAFGIADRNDIEIEGE